MTTVKRLLEGSFLLFYDDHLIPLEIKYSQSMYQTVKQTLNIHYYPFSAHNALNVKVGEQYVYTDVVLGMQ